MAAVAMRVQHEGPRLLVSQEIKTRGGLTPVPLEFARVRSAPSALLAALGAVLIGGSRVPAAEAGFSHVGDNDPVNEEGWQTPDIDPGVSDRGRHR